MKPQITTSLAALFTRRLPRTVMAGVCSLGLLLSAVPLFAEAGPGLELAQYKTVRVQPMVLASAADVRSMQSMVHGAADAATTDGQADMVASLTERVGEEGGDQGFGFGGSSRVDDIVSLQLGLTLGMLPLASEGERREVARVFSQLAEDTFLGAYAPAVRTSLQQVLSRAAEGELDVEAYVALMQDAAQGLADAADPVDGRFHGYFLVGMWAGSSLVCGASACDANLMANTGRSLAALLLEDAAYGGSDRQLAALVVSLIDELGKPGVEAGVILEILAAMQQIEHDEAA